MPVISPPTSTSMQIWPQLRELAAKTRMLLQLAGLWLERRRTRDQLSDLSSEQLRDVGLNPVTVRREIEKPFWIA
ncbi:DUF1127 domain-containing protein [Bradyrhizobium prioriisuperbiae]|uniref:DUF1127 domain-containing protein n=1 Tax=Bradyrhizobium prioriisuperbiae TaxID=2854389 RepID=UPI0028ECF9AB|nr:DUF1127 domain-containing protein [Bradyrhizobium prioritasuperba]